MINDTPQPNPARYRELSAPFEDQDEASEALEAFFAEVAVARVKFGIADVILLCEIRVGPEERPVASSLFLGSFTNRLPIIARAYGAARQEHEEMLGDVIAEGRKLVQPKGTR